MTTPERRRPPEPAPLGARPARPPPVPLLGRRPVDRARVRRRPRRHRPADRGPAPHRRVPPEAAGYAAPRRRRRRRRVRRRGFGATPPRRAAAGVGHRRRPGRVGDVDPARRPATTPPRCSVVATARSSSTPPSAWSCSALLFFATATTHTRAEMLREPGLPPLGQRLVAGRVRQPRRRHRERHRLRGEGGVCAAARASCSRFLYFAVMEGAHRRDRSGST